MLIPDETDGVEGRSRPIPSAGGAAQARYRGSRRRGLRRQFARILRHSRRSWPPIAARVCTQGQGFLNRGAHPIEGLIIPVGFRGTKNHAHQSIPAPFRAPVKPSNDGDPSDAQVPVPSRRCSRCTDPVEGPGKLAELEFPLPRHTWLKDRVAPIRNWVLAAGAGTAPVSMMRMIFCSSESHRMMRLRWDGRRDSGIPGLAYTPRAAIGGQLLRECRSIRANCRRNPRLSRSTIPRFAQRRLHLRVGLDLRFHAVRFGRGSACGSTL